MQIHTFWAQESSVQIYFIFIYSNGSAEYFLNGSAEYFAEYVASNCNLREQSCNSELNFDFSNSEILIKEMQNIWTEEKLQAGRI